MFGAMAAALVASLCVPEAFGDLGLTFALAYGVLRAAHLGLYAIGARGEPLLRRSIAGLAVGTAIGVGLLVAASFADGWVRRPCCGRVGPRCSTSADRSSCGVEGWQIVPEHFTERFGAVRASSPSASRSSRSASGPRRDVDARRRRRRRARRGHRRRAVVDVLRRRRRSSPPSGWPRPRPAGRRTTLARDAWAYLHYPMIAGIVLVAFGLKTTIAHVGDPLGAIPAVALLGGAALYLLAHVALPAARDAARSTCSASSPPLLLVALVPVGSRVPALVAAAIVAAVVLRAGRPTRRGATTTSATGVRHAGRAELISAAA